MLNEVNANPAVDSIAEFKVQSVAMSAEYGFTLGGMVNVATKGGANRIRGSLYDFLRNDAMDARNAFVMTRLLGEVTRAGTAAKVQQQFQRGDLYGKTGTTNDSMDAWFAGYAPGLTAVVWIGYDQPRKLGDRETGGGLSLPVWIDYMSMALKGVPVAEPAPPDGLVHQNGEWFYEETTRGGGIQSLFRKNTKVLFMEAPGSLTFEVGGRRCDRPARRPTCRRS